MQQHPGFPVGSRIEVNLPLGTPANISAVLLPARRQMMAETRTALTPSMQTETKQRATGLNFQRRFTDGKVAPFDAVEWERRTALIGNDKGQVIFRQENVEVPKSWSQTATNIVVSKYFHGKP